VTVREYATVWTVNQALSKLDVVPKAIAGVTRDFAAVQNAGPSSSSPCPPRPIRFLR
jgi:hypothetical protein